MKQQDYSPRPESHYEKSLRNRGPSVITTFIQGLIVTGLAIFVLSEKGINLYYDQMLAILIINEILAIFGVGWILSKIASAIESALAGLLAVTVVLLFTSSILYSVWFLFGPTIAHWTNIAIELLFSIIS